MAVLVDALSASAEPPGCSASAGELLPTGSANGICLPGTPADTAEGLRPGHQNTGPHFPPTGGGDARRPGAARVCVWGGAHQKQQQGPERLAQGLALGSSW